MSVDAVVMGQHAAVASSAVWAGGFVGVLLGLIAGWAIWSDVPQPCPLCAYLDEGEHEDPWFADDHTPPFA